MKRKHQHTIVLLRRLNREIEDRRMDGAPQPVPKRVADPETAMDTPDGLHHLRGSPAVADLAGVGQEEAFQMVEQRIASVDLPAAVGCSFPMDVVGANRLMDGHRDVWIEASNEGHGVVESDGHDICSAAAVLANFGQVIDEQADASADAHLLPVGQVRNVTGCEDDQRDSGIVEDLGRLFSKRAQSFPAFRLHDDGFGVGFQ